MTQRHPSLSRQSSPLAPSPPPPCYESALLTCKQRESSLMSCGSSLVLRAKYRVDVPQHHINKRHCDNLASDSKHEIVSHELGFAQPSCDSSSSVLAPPCHRVHVNQRGCSVDSNVALWRGGGIRPWGTRNSLFDAISLTQERGDVVKTNNSTRKELLRSPYL